VVDGSEEDNARTGRANGNDEGVRRVGVRVACKCLSWCGDSDLIGVEGCEEDLVEVKNPSNDICLLVR